ncbi:hypothetical protein ASNO1_01560 [Corallococcus caeni]|uniref:Uncharacterized protein n=1 Tax=Corallococcus caeni TaxID=3082388 RepID=A0ABQ6QIL0_9BACT|nr:hypothetical protein ASNO1_01560 [Corallococcus sp. NO1]
MFTSDGRPSANTAPGTPASSTARLQISEFFMEIRLTSFPCPAQTGRVPLPVGAGHTFEDDDGGERRKDAVDAGGGTGIDGVW